MADGKERQLGKYRLARRLGQGGMGVVFEAVDTRLNRKVALKVLPKHLAARKEISQRFLREARLAASLNHPNVVTVHDADDQDGYCYLVMELLTGGNAQDLLKHGPLNWREATQIIADVCRGLAAAHAKGLIHRDIKPSNIMRSADGLVKLADFGLAKATAEELTTLTAAGSVMGTPHFMSPEQCRGEPLDERSDLYSLGATYYTLLTGINPFPEDGTVQVMFAHCSKPVPNVRETATDVPDECARIIERAMAKQRTDRFESASEMLAALSTLVRPPAFDALDATLPPSCASTGPKRAVATAAPALSLPPASQAETTDPDVTAPVPPIALTPGEPPATATYPTAAPSVPLASAPAPIVKIDPSDRRGKRPRALVGRRGVRIALWIAAGVVAIAGLVAIANRRAPDMPDVPVTFKFAAEIPIADKVGGIRGLAFSARDEFLYFGGSDGTVRKVRFTPNLFAQQPPAVEREYRNQGASINALALSPDGRWLAAASGPAIYVWKESDGSQALFQVLTPVTPDAFTMSVAFGAGGHLAVGTTSNLTLFEVQGDQWKVRQTLLDGDSRPVRAYMMNDVAFSPDGKRLASVWQEAKSIAVWDVATGKLLERFSELPAFARSVTFEPAGRELVFSSDDKTIRCWAPGSGAAPSVIHAGTTDVRTLSLSSDGSRLAAGGEWGGPLLLLDRRHSEHSHAVPFECHATPFRVAFSRHMDWLVVGGGGDRNDERNAFLKVFRVVPRPEKQP